MFYFPVSSYLYIFIRGIDYSIVFSLFTASCNAYSFLSCYEILVHDHATISEFNSFMLIANLHFTIDISICIYFITVHMQHWIACIWGCVAFVEAGLSFDDSLLTTTNWISNWYKQNYVEGGINPIGWEHSWDRYFLCLFWSCQSITSIG